MVSLLCVICIYICIFVAHHQIKIIILIITIINHVMNMVNVDNNWKYAWRCINGDTTVSSLWTPHEKCLVCLFLIPNNFFQLLVCFVEVVQFNKKTHLHWSEGNRSWRGKWKTVDTIFSYHYLIRQLNGHLNLEAFDQRRDTNALLYSFPTNALICCIQYNISYIIL